MNLSNNKYKHGGTHWDREYRDGGSIISDRTFTDADLNKLLASGKFRDSWNYRLCDILEKDGTRILGKYNPKTNTLFIAGQKNMNNPLVVWMSENGYVNDREIAILKNGGAIDSLEKELRKLQRDLNSERLRTYREGDNSEEEIARQKEREVKLARFNEVLSLLREKDKFANGGRVDISEFSINDNKLFQCLISVFNNVSDLVNQNNVIDTFIDTHNQNYVFIIKNSNYNMEDKIKNNLSNISECHNYINYNDITFKNNVLSIPLKNISDKYANGGGVDFMARGGAIKQNEGKLFNEKGEMLVYKKQSETSSIYDVDVYEPRKTDVEENSKFKYCKREKNGRECVYRLDKKALLEMIKKEKFIYANGGGVKTDFDELENTELKKALISFWNDFFNNNIGNYLSIEKENYILSSIDNVFVIVRDKDKGNFSDVEKQKIDVFLRPYFDSNKKPSFTEFFNKYEINDNKIIIYIKAGKMYAKGGSVKDTDITVGKIFNLINGDIIEIKKLFVENIDEAWVQYTRNGILNENSVKELRLFINRLRNKFANGGGVGGFPKEGETILPKDIDYDMMDYLSRTNKELLITLKNGEKVKSSVGKFYNDLIFHGKLPSGIQYSHYSIQKKQFEKIQILNSDEYANGGGVGDDFSNGFLVSEMRDYLNKKFPDSFGFTVNTPESNTRPDFDLIPNKKEKYKGLSDSEIKSKLYFPQYKRDHEINYKIYQGSENTYFYFYLNDENGNPYIGQFGFKDDGDVDSTYITRFIAFLMEQYGLPFNVSHDVYAKGGGVKAKKGDIGKQTGKQYGYTLSEAEKAWKNILVSPTDYWKKEEGSVYTDSFGRRQVVRESSKMSIMTGYAYRIMVLLDLGSKKVPASAKKYAMSVYEFKPNEISGKSYKNGGGVGFDVYDFDKKMSLINLDMIYEYSVKLDEMVTEESSLEEWVKMKLTKVEQNIADVKHSLSGWEKFEKGGMIFKKQLLHISKYAKDLINMIQSGSKLMSWQENKLAISADYIDGIYHHLDYIRKTNLDKLDEYLGKYRNGGGVGEIAVGNIYSKKMPYYYKGKITEYTVQPIVIDNIDDKWIYFQNYQLANTAEKMPFFIFKQKIEDGLINPYHIKDLHGEVTHLVDGRLNTFLHILYLRNLADYLPFTKEEFSKIKERFNDERHRVELKQGRRGFEGEYIDDITVQISRNAWANSRFISIHKLSNTPKLNESFNKVIVAEQDNRGTSSYFIYDSVDDFIINHETNMKNGGGVGSYNLDDEINKLYEKSGFINTDFNWKLKLLEMLQDQSIEAYNIYQKLSKEQKEDVLQEQFELDNDMGSYGDGDIETSKENLQILLEDAKNGKKYAKGGGVGYSEYSNDALQNMIVNLSRYENTEDDVRMIKDELERRKEDSDLKFASKKFSKTIEMLVKDNLNNGEINISILKSIIGHEPNYPIQIVGSLKLKKCYLRPYYKLA